MQSRAASAVLKCEIEARLAARVPGALSPMPRQVAQLLPTGVPAVDRLLGGGLPLGGITEMAGAAGSGRTALALSVLAGATHEAACAYVDVRDCLDPVSAAAAGVRMENLLWVRLRSRVGLPSQVIPALPYDPAAIPGRALSSMLARKAETRRAKQEKTPGYPNQPFSLAAAPEEQVAYERFFERGGYEGKPSREAAATRKPLPARAIAASAGPEKPLGLLDKAIRAADQILQSGGFRVVVLDLASVAPEQALRVPAATWFRFRRAAEVGNAVLLVLAEQPCAGSSAVCVLHCAPGGASVENGFLRSRAQSVEVARQRVAGPGTRKAPGRATAWAAVPHWARMEA